MMLQEWAPVQTPAYIIKEELLEKNLRVLQSVASRTGCKILLAQKAFSMFYFYPLIGKYLAGATASGLYEAKLGKEAMPGENHIFSPAYKESEFDEILSVCDHLVFNSFTQWKKFRSRALAVGKICGLRINPEHSTQEHGIYDPCAAGSRLGIPLAAFEEGELDGVSGLHFHTLCEQNSDALEEFIHHINALVGDVHIRQCGVDAQHVHTEFHKTR